MSVVTIAGRYHKGKITLLEAPPETGDCEVLVTFVGLDKDYVTIPKERYEQLAGHTIDLSTSAPLTPQEIDILRLVNLGRTNDDIAKELNLKSGTVRNYLSGIYKKLGTHNRTETIMKATELGLLR